MLNERRDAILKALQRRDGDYYKAADDLEMDPVALRSLCRKDPYFKDFKNEEMIMDRQVALKNQEDKRITETFQTKTVINTLEGLMTKVTETDCTPEAVMAACNCAGKINDLLRTHLDVEKLRLKVGGR